MQGKRHASVGVFDIRTAIPADGAYYKARSFLAHFLAGARVHGNLISEPNFLQIVNYR